MKIFNKLTTKKKRVLLKNSLIFISLCLIVGLTTSFYSDRQIEPKFQKEILGSWDYNYTSKSNQTTTKLATTTDGLKVKVEKGRNAIIFQTPLESNQLIVNDNKATFGNIDDPIQITYELVPEGVKEEIILHQPTNQNSFESRFDTAGLTPVIDEETMEVNLFDKNNHEQLRFTTPFAYDSDGNTTYNVVYKLQQVYIDQKPSYILNVEVDPDWLFSQDRVYPIVIDPTVVAPNAPIINSDNLPDNIITLDTTPTLLFSATDPQGDDVTYYIEWDDDSSFPSPSSAVSDTDAGFTNTSSPGTIDPFFTGDTIEYTFQSALTTGTTYYYRLKGKDPWGSNTYGDWSETRSITIDTSRLTVGWHQTDADQFNTNTNSANILVDDVGEEVELSGASGDTTTTAINSSAFTSLSNWGYLSFVDVETSSDIKYSVYYDVSGTPTIIPDGDLTGNSTGFDTSPVALDGLSIADYPIIYLKADLTDSGSSPLLQEWELTFYDNEAPTQPVITADALADNIVTADTTPTVSFSSTDPQSNDIVYEIEWYTDADFSSASSAISDSDAGFSNLTTPADTSPFTTGETIQYIFQSALANSTTYYYQIRGKDPSGGGSFGSWSETRSMTIDTSKTSNGWFQTDSDQFSANTNSSTAGNESGDYSEITFGDLLLTKTITITNSGASETDYQVLIELDTAALITNSKIQSDCDDFRFYSDSGFTTAIDYWIESGCDTTTTQIWVEVPNLPNGDTDIYMTYGDSSLNSGEASWSGNFIAGHVASCPTGWSATTSLNTGNYFLYGDLNYGVVDGSNTHNHTISGTTATNTSDTFFESQTAGSTTIRNHTHSYSVTSDDDDNIPPYLSTIMCQASANTTTLSTDYLGIFEATPSGWVLNNDYNDKFIRASDSAGIVGGISSHANTYSGSTNATTGNKGSGSGSKNFSPNAHTMSGTVDSTTSLPSYLDVVIATPSATTYYPETTAITTFDILPPLGWEAYSSLTNYFPRGSVTPGSTGGSDTHDHTYSGTTGTVSGIGVTWDYIAFPNHGNSHNHTYSGTTKLGNSLPAYTTVIYAQKKTDSMTNIIGSETAVETANTRTDAIILTDIDSQLGNWSNLVWNDTESNGSISYQILYDNSGTPTLIPDTDLTGNSSGFGTSPLDLSGLDAQTYATLYFQANLTYTTGTPLLNEWGMDFTAPNVPTLDSPTDTATDQSNVPALLTTATDPNNSNLQYKITLCLDSAMTDSCQIFDQTSSQTGWSGQNADTSTTYTSGTQATYTIQTALVVNTTYYWKSAAIDPSDTNSFGGTQTTPYSFTTAAAPLLPNECTIGESVDDSTLTLNWVDDSSDEDGFNIERSVEGGGFASLNDPATNSTSYADSTVTQGNTYQYRVRSYKTVTGGDAASEWCTTSTISLESSVFSFEGLSIEGVKID